MKILILGHTGKMGRALMEVLKDYELMGFNSEDFDANDLVFRFGSFDVIINCVAFMSIDACEQDMNQALRVNTLFPTIVAHSLHPNQTLVHFSTDAVFPDGGPFGENSEPFPLLNFKVNPVLCPGNSSLGYRALPGPCWQ